MLSDKDIDGVRKSLKTSLTRNIAPLDVPRGADGGGFQDKLAEHGIDNVNVLKLSLLPTVLLWLKQPKMIESLFRLIPYCCRCNGCFE